MFVYALGFAAGSYVVLKIEERIVLDYSRLEIITAEENGNRLADEIIKLGKAVTNSKGSCKDGEKVELSTFVKRKIKEIV